MSLVAIISYYKTKGEVGTPDGYFLASRGLNGIFIAGSLLLTNLSAEHLIGLNGSAYGHNLSSMAWEVTAAISTICMAYIFLPRYLAGAFTTLPEFLCNRFDEDVRRLLVILFMFGYGLVTIPSVLYSGSIAVLMLFDLPSILNISYSQSLAITIVMIGSIGAVYAVFGGLKAVAVSDTLNGIGLLIGGLAIPFLALATLGDGSFFEGLSKLVNQNPEYLTVLTQSNLEGKNVSVPWPTLFTGMMFIQVFYWSTNQVIVQRAMAARSLAEGQKGVLFASGMKLIGPLMLCLPALIALHMPELKIERQDQVYGAVVRHVLPDWSLGLFAAVLVGSILSSFNSALNSASTLFSLQFYKGYINPSASEEQTVVIGKYFGILLALSSIIIAPLLAQMDSIFQFLQKVNGLYSVPIIAIFLLGITTKHIPALAAKIGMIVGMVMYGFFIFYPIDNLHWLHTYFISFTWSIIIMLLIGYFKPKSDQEIALSDEKTPAPVDMTPWPLAKTVSAGIFGTTIAIYLLLTALSN